MKNRRKIIFIDVDGTLIDFRSMDKIIISKIFENSSFVKKLDDILWWINDFDVIGYSNFIFYFRMFLYSILSKKNIKETLREYENMYCKYSLIQITPKLKECLDILEKHNYQVCIVTRNMYAKCISKKLGRNVNIVKNKRRFYSRFYYNYNVFGIIGNNYMDDIVSCYILNSLYRKYNTRNKVKPFYIGKSKVIKTIVDKNTNCFDNFEECVKYLKSVVD